MRGDSGFVNDVLMAWCEANGVDYVFGLARNPRLEAALAAQLAVAKLLHSGSSHRARVFRDFRYQTLDSWSRSGAWSARPSIRSDGANPRFIVTSLPRRRYDGKRLYEELYCARGEAENRIGEQFELFADRASSATIAANQLRMWFSGYRLYSPRHPAPRRSAPYPFADAAVATIRLKLLKLGARVRISVRRIHFAIATGCPDQDVFACAYDNLQRAFSSA